MNHFAIAMPYPDIRRRQFDRENIGEVENYPGVYILFYYGRPVYIGQSDSLYYRLLEHVGKREDGKLKATQFSVYYLWEVGERAQLEADLIHRHHPRSNRRCPMPNCDYYWK